MLKGRVVKVADGDTITVLDAANVRHRIRLDKIDVPEKSQPLGDALRKHLAAFVEDKIVEVEWTKKDKYGRILGTVWVMLPMRTDVNLQMVKDGFAWHYRHFDNKNHTPMPKLPPVRRNADCGKILPLSYPTCLDG